MPARGDRRDHGEFADDRADVLLTTDIVEGGLD